MSGRGVLLAAAYMAVAQRIDPETGTLIGRLPLENPSRGHLSGLAADGVGGGPGGGHIVDAAPGCVVANLDFGNRYSPPSAAPAAVDVTAESDTGFSSADDLTHSTTAAPPSLSLDLIVDGTVAGAIVEVYAGGGDRQRHDGRKRDADHHARRLRGCGRLRDHRKADGSGQAAVAAVAAADNHDRYGRPRGGVAVAQPAEHAGRGGGHPAGEKVFGVAAGSFSLAIDGGGNLLSGEEPITSPGQQRYTLGGLSPMTQRHELIYRLVLTAGDQIRDLAGNPLAAGAAAEWTQSLAALRHRRG